MNIYSKSEAALYDWDANYSRTKTPYIQYILFRFLQDAQYKAEYHAEHPTIKFFWEVFHELSDEDKKNFLSKSDPCFLFC